MTKIPKRYLLVAKKVLYKSLIDIAPLSSTLHAINGQFICQLKKWPITWMAIVQTLDPKNSPVIGWSGLSLIDVSSCQKDVK